MASSPVLQSAIATASNNQTGVDPSYMASMLTAIAQTESSGNQNAAAAPTAGNPNPTSKGYFGITDAFSQQWGGQSTASLDPGWQATTAATGLAYYTQLYNGNTELALAAYNKPASAAAINTYMNNNPGTSFAYAANATGNSASLTYVNQVESNSATPLPGSTATNAAIDAAANPAPTYTVADSDNIPVVGNVTGQAVTTQVAANVTPTLIVDTDLTLTPWYKDSDLVRGTKKLNAFNPPVSFQILLPNGQLLGHPGAAPITLRLNASIKTYDIEQSHVVNNTITRTGMMMTMWGQQADLITGTASTGAFMNQLGLTQFMSMSTLDVQTQQLLNQSFDLSVGDEAMYKLANQPSALRVAAEDCFMEFLALFKNNGVVYFQPTNQQAQPIYNGTVNTTQQTGVTAWSPLAGSSTYEASYRNNDVLTRGEVVFYFGTNTYYGYFKSLNWRMDAEKPYQWDFNFVFQVEHTSSATFFPN
jgi:Transglycosylase SLT domain